MSTFTVLMSPGPAWIPGKSSREQLCWDEHAAFMDGLFNQGQVILGGPYADYSGILVILTAENADSVQAVFAHDPFLVNGVTTLTSVNEWLIFLDSRQKA